MVTSGPGPAYHPYVPYWGGYYGGAGFYHGAYYGNTGYYRNRYGGSAYWNDGSGVPTVHEAAPPTGMMGPEAQPDWRGSTASWDHGSGHISGYRGGSASWGGGSGSVARRRWSLGFVEALSF